MKETMMEEPTTNRSREEGAVASADMEAVLDLGVVLSFCDLPALRALRPCCKLFWICVDKELDQRIEEEIIPRMKYFSVGFCDDRSGNEMKLQLNWSETNSTEDGLVQEAIARSDPDNFEEQLVFDKVAFEQALRRDSKVSNVYGEQKNDWSVCITKPRSVEQEFALAKCKECFRHVPRGSWHKEFLKLRDYTWAVLCRTTSLRYSHLEIVHVVHAEGGTYLEGGTYQRNFLFFCMGRHGNQKLELGMYRLAGTSSV